LRARLFSYLSFEPISGPLDTAIPHLDIMVQQSRTVESVGSQIGPYKIREQLAEGGMGIVYVAEQSRPVQRKVALKVIKPGLATKDVIARFEAERQALAMMEHPNIARVIDGGATESGNPYFVMELVQGLPITEYCDTHSLDTRQRLQLFNKVCRAVQHAHQKGIIHRDLKPSNVLVARIDDEAVPKVIDFGIAKAISHKMSEQTVYTQFSQMVGTPLYMSPEQAELGVIDIDTRSDVYSLGAMLYELLTGRTPFNSDTLKAAGFDEMRRIIREQEPPRPSALVSTLNAAALSTVAERRQHDPRKLRESQVGELDWIVMKALEKDRNRRYESASAFAEDLNRYLQNEPVTAAPPSFVYQCTKFVKRHKFSAAITAVTVFALLVFMIGLTVAVFAVIREKKRTNSQRVLAEQNLLVARSAIDDMLDRVADELEKFPETEELKREILIDAVKYYEQISTINSDSVEVQRNVGIAALKAAEIHSWLGHSTESLEAFQAARATFEHLYQCQPDHLLENMIGLKTSQNGIASVLYTTGKWQESMDASKAALNLVQQISNKGHKVADCEMEALQLQYRIGRTCERLGKTEASKWFQSVHQQLSEWDFKDIEDPQLLDQKIALMAGLTNRDFWLGKDQAVIRKAYETIITDTNRLIKLNPKNPGLRESLAVSL
ncbi:MAG: serine/threonine protein kinase, partial [Planctomycetales bacterium]|nr:serine/threonine protein kinase [Planctomycetales bacterium]